MAEFTLAERLRTAHVKRWQIVRVAREQNIAEHMYLVRQWTLAFAEVLKLPANECIVAQLWALEHDVPETRTGDLATPVKVAMRNAVPHGYPIRTIELAMSDSYREIYRCVKNDLPHLKVLVKLADLVEAVHFLDIEGIGTHAATVKRGIWKNFTDLIDKAIVNFPVHDWRAVYNIAVHETGA